MSALTGTSNRKTYEGQPATAGPSEPQTDRILHDEPLQEEPSSSQSQPNPLTSDERNVWDERNLLTFGTRFFDLSHALPLTCTQMEEGFEDFGAS